MLLSENKKSASQLQFVNEQKGRHEREVKDKLQRYVKNHNTAKDKWLLASHAHCFICIS